MYVKEPDPVITCQLDRANEAGKRWHIKGGIDDEKGSWEYIFSKRVSK